MRTGPPARDVRRPVVVGAYAPAGLMPWAVLGFAFERYYDLLLAFLVLTFPDARLRRWDRIVLGALAAGYVLRTSSRRWWSCPCTGSDNPFAVVEQQELFVQAQLFTSALIAVAALGVAARAVLRLRSSTAAARRILRPVVPRRDGGSARGGLRRGGDRRPRARARSTAAVR